MILKTKWWGKCMPSIAVFQHVMGPSEMVSFRLYDKFLPEGEASLINAFVLEVPEVSHLQPSVWRSGGQCRERESGQKINKIRVKITGNLDLDREGCRTRVLFFQTLSSRPCCFKRQSRCHIFGQFCSLVRLSLFHVDLEQRKINETNSSGRQSGGSWERTELHRLSDIIQEAPKFTQPGILKKKIS